MPRQLTVGYRNPEQVMGGYSDMQGRSEVADVR